MYVWVDCMYMKNNVGTGVQITTLDGFDNCGQVLSCEFSNIIYHYYTSISVLHIYMSFRHLSATNILITKIKKREQYNLEIRTVTSVSDKRKLVGGHILPHILEKR